MKWAQTKGFTIVELLIVIVVIGILAAITLVTYNGVQGRAYDASIQSDLVMISKKIMAQEVIDGVFPTGPTDLKALNLRINKSAYDLQAYDNTGSGSYYNLVYCWPSASNSNNFAIVAKSKSGNVFQFSRSTGVVSKVAYTFSGGSSGICGNAGAALSDGNSRDWFYSANVWQGFVSG